MGLKRSVCKRLEKILPDPVAEVVCEDEPAEGDYLLSDEGVHVVGEGSRGFLGKFDDDVEALDAIGEDMEEKKFWPNVWMLSDHGNIHGPVDMREHMPRKRGG